MDYSKYYTPLKVAEFLINQLNIKKPYDAIDICCGSCNLLSAAKKRWNNIKLVGVDIIDLELNGIEYIKCDGRKYALENKNKYSLILANPPFDYLEKKSEYLNLFDEIPFKYETSRLEIEMLFANLFMLKDDGVLLIIMPNTFVLGETHSKIRKYLASEYSVRKIFFLPDNTFGATNISSCALVLEKDKKNHRYTNILHLKNNDDCYCVFNHERISYKDMKNGNWNLKPIIREPSFNIRIKRGNTSSHFFSDRGEDILHISRVAEDWSPTIRHVSKVNDNPVYAENGDIIVSRIGKSAGSWYKYTGNKVLVSDCLFVIKEHSDFIEGLLKGKKYPYNLRGVATKYITIADVVKWINTLIEQAESETLF